MSRVIDLSMYAGPPPSRWKRARRTVLVALVVAVLASATAVLAIMAPREFVMGLAVGSFVALLNRGAAGS